MRQFRQFVEVAERRSISRAAEHLHLSQPALSRSIRQLEQSYGVDLFIRTGSGVTLSAFGTLLYGSAIRALRALDQGREEINLLKGSAKAPIRIAAGRYASGPIKIAHGAVHAVASRLVNASAIGGPPPVSSHSSSRRPAGQLASRRGNSTDGRISGTLSRSVCSAASIALARRRSRLTRSTTV